MLLTSHIDSTDSLCRLQSTSTNFSPEISFSSNGEHIVIKDTPSGLPTVQLLQSLPAEFLQTLITEDVESPQLGLPSFGAASTGLSSTAGTELANPTDTMAKNSSHNRIIITNKSTDNVTITLWDHASDANKTKTFELSKLPNWEGIHKTNVSVKLPRKKDEFVKIILNKGINDWSDFSDPAHEQFPAVITRHPKTIKNISASKRERDCGSFQPSVAGVNRMFLLGQQTHLVASRDKRARTS
jgi:hypothetical protein